MDAFDFKLIDKHFGAFVRALDAKAKLRPHDAKWQEFYRETCVVVGTLARKLEEWKSGSPRRDATYDPNW